MLLIALFLPIFNVSSLNFYLNLNLGLHSKVSLIEAASLAISSLVLIMSYLYLDNFFANSLP